jgi:hypothetical protein
MSLFNVNGPDNGIKVGDIITAFHKGYWAVTSIEQRIVTKDEEDRFQGRYGKAGDQKNSMIYYELLFDSNFKPSGKKKKKNSCDAYYCKKVDDAFFIERIKEFNEQIDAFCHFASAIKAIGQMTKFPINLMSLGGFQSMFAAHKVGEWLDIAGNTKSSADATHSALLQRLLSGKPALEKAPPCNMSYPWYELGEGNKIELDPEFNREVTVNGTKVHFGNTGPFQWVDQPNGIVVYPPSGEHFKVWKEGKKRFIQKVEYKVEIKPAPESKPYFKPLVDENGKWTGCDYCGSVDCDGEECRR